MIYKFDEYLFEKIIDEHIEYQTCNEKVNLKGVVDKIKNINITGIFKNIMKNIKDKNLNYKDVINKLLNIANDSKNKVKKETIIIVSFFIYISNVSSYSIKTDDLNSYKNEIKSSKEISKLIDNDNITYDDIINFTNKDIISVDKLDNDPYFIQSRLVNYKKLSASDYVKEQIKNEEKLRLKAYTLSSSKKNGEEKTDGKITIGYGHAEDIKDSKYKKGDIITKKTAEKLFEKDLKIAENGVRRIFRDWEKQGIYIDISQGMYDALISIAYNSGVGGLRSSQMIQRLKEKDYMSAANLILKTRVKNSKQFPGLLTRRKNERDLFLKDIVNKDIKYTIDNSVKLS